MKVLFIIIIHFFALVSNCQSNEFDCLILQKAVNNNFFNKYFLIDKFPKETLTIIDTCNFFQNCIIKEVHNRKIEIRHYSNFNKSKHEIYIDYMKKVKRKTTIAFFHPMSNVYLVLEIRKKIGGLRVKVKSGGVF